MKELVRSSVTNSMLLDSLVLVSDLVQFLLALLWCPQAPQSRHLEQDEV